METHEIPTLLPPLSSEKRIILSLSKFLDIILSHHDWILFADQETAQLLKILDKDESFCHVEFSSELNAMTIALSIGSRPEDNFDGASQLPIIWRKVAWETSHPKFTLRKKQGEDKRQASLLKAERVNKVIAGMIETTGVDDRDLWEPKAIKLVEAQAWGKIECVWGVKL